MTQQTFDWQCQPQAESLLLTWLESNKTINPRLQELEHSLAQFTSTRLLDWIDHFVEELNDQNTAILTEAGFVEDLRHHGDAYQAWHHPGAQLPRVMLVQSGHDTGVAIRVDSIADFLMVRGMRSPIEGSPLSSYRRCQVWSEGDAAVWIVERRDSWTLEPATTTPDQTVAYHLASELWRTRPRSQLEDEAMMQEAQSVAEQMIELVGRDMAAWIVMEVERDYWQARNRAGQVQKARQDRLGMGWANHDHHTFRSSRRFFNSLIQLMETLGFYCREKFYAGDEAGWGAQVMENSDANLILFLDVDLSPEEVHIDFSTSQLPESEELGTIGLWCALHGDSLLAAGMHHLEGQFEFEGLTKDLEEWGIGMMQPFSNFDYLKQAFTKGERWAVSPQRLEALRATGRITAEQAEKFASTGAIGSHLENLQRREGYKGFNQKNVSFIIAKTDPRNR